MGRHKAEKWVYIDMPGIKKEYYMISSWGRIKNIKDKFLSYYDDKDGYKKCTLSTEDGKKKKHFMVHRLVAIHFIPNPENKPEVNHLMPEDKSNLYYEHLEWVTTKENHAHARKHKLQTIVSCSAHGMSTLTNEQVHEICSLMEKGYKNKEIIDHFKIKDKKKREKLRGVLKHIRARKTWLPISKHYKF